MCASLESDFLFIDRSLYVGSDIVPLFGEDTTATYMELFYTSSVDRAPCYFRASSTVLRRCCVAVRVEFVECFYQRQDQFSGNLSFFACPGQYERLGFHVEASGEIVSLEPHREPLMEFSILKRPITDGEHRVQRRYLVQVPVRHQTLFIHHRGSPFRLHNP